MPIKNSRSESLAAADLGAMGGQCLPPMSSGREASSRVETPLSLQSMDMVPIASSQPALSVPSAAELAASAAPAGPGGLEAVAWLVVAHADGYTGSPLISLRRWLRLRGEVILGREGADISFSHLSISKTHVCISQAPRGGFKIVDLDSTNGTFVASGLRGTFTQLRVAAQLTDRSAIRMGDVLLVFRSFLGTPGSYGGS